MGICGYTNNIHRRCSPHTCRRCRTNRLTNIPATDQLVQTSSRRIGTGDVPPRTSRAERKCGICGPGHSSFESGCPEYDSRCNRRVAATCGAPSASYERDRLAKRPAAGARTQECVVGQACCPAVDGFLAVAGLVPLWPVLVDSQSPSAADDVVAAGLAAFWPAAVVVLQNCLVCSAVPAADDPAAAWLFVALVCWNCPVVSVVERLPCSWIAVVGAVALAGVLLVDLVQQDLPAVSAFQQAFLVFAAFPAPSVCPVDPGVKKLEQSNQGAAVSLP